MIAYHGYAGSVPHRVRNPFQAAWPMLEALAFLALAKSDLLERSSAMTELFRSFSAVLLSLISVLAG
jgi:hypothetical protein